ncbi:hypothetical protein Ple7327_0027 [Pleurocapsa sp. PCC 7327]|uniref:DUF6683 family protein n=1 Tax=Pleurocapsa sp. PCC 7327 TaxID=118163 RepID=UPI00029FF254|nr:DUF6683 family protein [Pleurocapsa sp. PCC 7327]AFY75517.1 hypothetical protein Ple7327_0027 [Pleurocapsa sp. PCC 7327]
MIEGNNCTIDRAASGKLIFAGTLLIAAVFSPLPLAAQISNIDIPYMAFYDHQGTYASTIGIGTSAAQALTEVSPQTISAQRLTGETLPASALSFRYSPQVTMQVRDRIAEQFAAQSPEQAVQIRCEFAQADVVGEFRRLIQRYGYDPDNLAHNMAAFLILQWEVLTETQAQPPQMKGAAEQVAEALLAGSLLHGMSDADKQTVADSMAYQALMSVLVFNDLKQRGDSTGIARLREGIIRSARELGWDFNRIELTSRGFVAAR